MSALIVLGLIPGTHIQITFLLWLIGAGALSAVVFGRLTYRTRAFQAWIIATSLLLALRHPDFRTAA